MYTYVHIICVHGCGIHLISVSVTVFMHTPLHYNSGTIQTGEFINTVIKIERSIKNNIKCLHFWKSVC